MTDLPAFELQYAREGEPRDTFGFCEQEDDLPMEVTTVEREVWVLRYVDQIDRIAVYTRKAAPRRSRLLRRK